MLISPRMSNPIVSNSIIRVHLIGFELLINRNLKYRMHNTPCYANTTQRVKSIIRSGFVMSWQRINSLL